MAIATRRTTQQTEYVRDSLQRMGHVRVADVVRQSMKDGCVVSTVTVHRALERLRRDGECILAPATRNREKRYDANLLPHDHFECVECGKLRDLHVSSSSRSDISQQLAGCRLTGQIHILGKCQNCLKK